MQALNTFCSTFEFHTIIIEISTFSEKVSQPNFNSLKTVWRNPTMSTLENVWENRSAGVKVVRESLLLWLSEGEDVGQLLEEKKGSYCEKLKCWLLDYRNLSYSSCPFDSSGRWMNVEGEFAVFKPEPGLQISTTFMELKDGRALCGVEAGDCGWMVYVEGMTEEQMKRLEPGQTIVVKLNLVAIELSGKLLLMGCRIFEDNNNAVTVEEGGDSVQGEEVRRSYVQASAANCVFFTWN